MRALIVAILLTACADPALVPDVPDAVDTNLPPPQLLLSVLLPGAATVTVLPTDPTATDLPTMPIIYGGQGSTMVLLNVAAQTAWPGPLHVTTWLERESDGAELASSAESWATLTPLGPLWVSNQLAFVVGSPCAAADQAVRAHAQVQGAGPEQSVVGRLRLAWPQGCP